MNEPSTGFRADTKGGPSVRTALTRAVSASLARCQLTHLVRTPIDLDRARAQHAEYERALGEAGCRVERVAGDDELPDAVFIEDTALVLPELAVVMRPGAPSRRPEAEGVARALSARRALVRIEAPETMDGGDILRCGREIYLGSSSRTSAGGIAELRRLVAPHGYRVRTVAVAGCLHLKSAVTEVAEDVLLVNAGWLGKEGRRELFRGRNLIEVDAREPAAANALRIGERVIYPAHHPRTARRLRAAGIELIEVDVSELAKAEGGVTCCSLVFDS